MSATDRRAESDCPNCGTANPWGTLWCAGCGRILPAEGDAALRIVCERLRARDGLFVQVLENLHELAHEAVASEAEVRQIRQFYAAARRRTLADIAQFEARVAMAPELQEVRACLQAHPQQWERALTLVRDLRQRHLDDPLLVDWQRRIMGQRDREKVKEQRFTAQGLLAAAQQCLAEEPAKARGLLEEVRKLGTLPPDLTQQCAATERALYAAKLSALEVAAAAAIADPPPAAEVVAVEEPAAAVPGAQAEFTASPVVVAEASATSPATNAAAVSAEDRDAPLPPRPWVRIVETTSHWSSLLKPFLIDNVGWFVGAFLIVAGFAVLIVAFSENIGENPLLKWSLTWSTLAAVAGGFFGTAYTMRVKYSELATASNVLLTLVSLLIPLVFAAAALTTLAR